MRVKQVSIWIGLLAGLGGALFFIASRASRCSPPIDSDIRPPAPSSLICTDERGQTYSEGALIRVSGTVMRCERSRWIPQQGTSPEIQAPPIPTIDPKAIPAVGCTDELGQRYSHSALARVDGVVKRCEKGKWVDAAR